MSAASPACRWSRARRSANYDAATGRYTLYAGSGGAVRQKNELATVLGIPPDNLRVVSPDVGGNFGTRNRVFVEFGLALWASKKLGRPVKYLATRSECFLTDYQGRDLVTKVELALDAKNRFLAMRATNISNVGARCVSLSPLSKGAGLIPGSYAIPVATLRAVAVYTNTMPTQAYRSSGRPEVTYAIERLIDAAAARARRRSHRAPPQESGAAERHAVPQCGRHALRFRPLRREYGLGDGSSPTGRVLRRGAARRSGAANCSGSGLPITSSSSIGAPREQARIKVVPQAGAGPAQIPAHVDAVIGTQPAGQGHETSFAQVLSDLMRVPVESVRIIMGDTDVVRAGGGTHSGRSMRHAATVFSKAAGDLIAKGKEIAAAVTGVAAENFSFTDGRFASRDTNLHLRFSRTRQ